MQSLGICQVVKCLSKRLLCAKLKYWLCSDNCKFILQAFLFRSWASVRVMTADQRAELIHRVVQDDLSEKLSYKDCEKIAKDLNLTLEQVRLSSSLVMRF
jgi:hypothetical protein